MNIFLQQIAIRKKIYNARCLNGFQGECTKQNLFKAKGKIKGEIHRNKGLGSLEPEQARRSMFNPAFQRLDVLEYTDEAINLLYDLMGEEVEPRREFIMNNVDFSEIRE
jgi:DNA gyrase/topoisomerase IV subunit B